MLQESLQSADFPKGDETLARTAAAVQRALEDVRKRLESRLPPDELAFCIDSIAGLRIAAHALNCVHSERAAAAESPRRVEPRPPLRIDYPGLARKVVQVAFAIGVLYAQFVMQVAPTVGGLLFLAYVALAFTLELNHRQPAEKSVAGATADQRPPLVDAPTLAARLVDAFGNIDAAMQRYASVARDLRHARTRRLVGDGQGSAYVSTFQQLLGAARRKHGQLGSLVEDESLAALEDGGLVPISYDAASDSQTYFDVQHDVESRLDAAVELYPALVSQGEKRLVLRGRVILPNPAR